MSTFNKFKTYKSDAAPFFFYIEVFPPDPTSFKEQHLIDLVNSIKTNPIMPLPMRVDRVFNGESSILIRPREPVSFSITEEIIATINPTPFIQFGFEKLLFFTEIRAYENLGSTITIERALDWWNSTNFLYSKLYRLEEDFGAFLRAYLLTIVKAKINNEDLVSAATIYCQMISDICSRRLEQNNIPVEMRGEQKIGKLYKKKEVFYYKRLKKTRKIEYHPELVDIELFDLSEKGFTENFQDEKVSMGKIKSKLLKYIPLLFYDDLLECMLQNLKRLENGDDNILDPSFLIDKNIIVLQESKDKVNDIAKNFSWWDDFNKIDLASIILSIRTTLQESFTNRNEERF